MPPSPLTLSTERHLLRPIVQDDLPQVFAGLSDPRVIVNYGVSYGSLEETREQMDWYRTIEADGSGRWWAICPKDRPDLMIGACGVNDIVADHRRAELGYWLLPEYWQQGIAFECVQTMLHFVFADMAIYRVGADVDMDNPASVALLLKLGFQREGIRRAYEFKDGRPIDLQLFSLIAADRAA